MALIEQHQEVSYSKNIGDVRSWDQKYAEQLSKPAFLATQVTVLVLASLAFKLFLLVWVIGFVVLLSIHLNYRVVLKLRYPPDGKDIKGKAGDGILYFGSLKSSNPFENMREIWMADSDLRTHFLILGSTGSGKSETLKGMFYNSLCWGSGFFLADGKADNKMPTDCMSMAEMLGVSDDFLALNFLIGGSSPQKIAASRRRRTNMINTFSDSDADTQIQMGANLLPKAEGEGKSWQEKALNFWRSLVVALCYKRDTQGFELSVGVYIDHMGLPKVEELYAEGYKEYIANGEWSYGFAGIKSYCESGGCPGFMVDRVLAKFNLPPDPASASRTGLPDARRAGPGGGPAAQAGKPAATKVDQDQATYDQHGYRIGQLMPALNLLDKTYGHIFRAKYSEIDMVDIALNNRILVMMIPSLEKSASEAENLGKLAIACLRVMMGRNLGADIEGHRSNVLESKATEANYPFLVALDELGYYFSDGIAIMFAQARSLGISMCAAAQDIEKLTEGSRQAEAGAMLANAVAKFFMRIDDAQKTWKLISDYFGKARVAVFDSYNLGAGGYNRDKQVRIEMVERASLEDLQGMGAGQGILNTRGNTFGVRALFVGDYLETHKLQDFRLNRFLQVRPLTEEEVIASSIPAEALDDKVLRGRRLLDILSHRASAPLRVQPDPILSRLEMVAPKLPRNIAGAERGAALYVLAKKAAEQLFKDERAPAASKGTTAKRINDTGVGHVAVPDGIGEGADAARVAGLPGFGGLAGLGNVVGITGDGRTMTLDQHLAAERARAAGGDEALELPTAAEIRRHSEGDRGADGPREEPEPIDDLATAGADSDDPLAFLNMPTMAKRPVAEVLATRAPKPAARPATVTAPAMPLPAAPVPAPAPAPASGNVTGFGLPATTGPVGPASGDSPDDAFLDMINGPAAAPAPAASRPPEANEGGFFDELDAPLTAPLASAPPVAAAPAAAPAIHAAHDLEGTQSPPRAMGGFGVSPVKNTKALSSRAMTSIATVVQAGREVTPRPIFAAGKNPPDNPGKIDSSATQAGYKTSGGGAAILGQSEDWVAEALTTAGTALRRVGPDAIGFDDPTRAAVTRVEGALGSPDPEAAALNTERIVAASVTPVDVEVDMTPAEGQDIVDNVMSSLG